MYEIEVKLIKVISILEYLNHLEDFNAYKAILKSYMKVLRNIQNKKREELNERDFESLQNVFRLFFEAVPSDDILAKYVAERMQDFYELQEKIIANNTP